LRLGLVGGCVEARTNKCLHETFDRDLETEDLT
jgi:hypothetical protein